MKKRFFIYFFFLFVGKISFAQDPYFNCFQRALLYYNPAFTGSSGQLRVQTATNYLWPGIGGYFTSFGSVDSYVGKGSSVGLSWNYQNENSFLFKKDIGLSYSNRISLFSKNIIFQPAIKVSYSSIRADWSQYQFADRIDSIKGFVKKTHEVPGLNSKSNMDIALGFLLYSKNFYFGLSAYHFIQPDEAFLGGPSKLPMRIGIQSAYDIKLTQQMFVIPSLQYTMQEDFQFLSVGSTFIYKKWATGLNYSSNRSLSINAGWQNERLKFGISHSIFFSGIPYSTTYGAWETNLSFLFLNPDPDRKFISPKGF